MHASQNTSWIDWHHQAKNVTADAGSAWLQQLEFSSQRWDSCLHFYAPCLDVFKEPLWKYLLAIVKQQANKLHLGRYATVMCTSAAIPAHGQIHLCKSDLWKMSCLTDCFSIWSSEHPSLVWRWPSLHPGAPQLPFAWVSCPFMPNTHHMLLISEPTYLRLQCKLVESKLNCSVASCHAAHVKHALEGLIPIAKFVLCLQLPCSLFSFCGSAGLRERGGLTWRTQAVKEMGSFFGITDEFRPQSNG